MEGIKVRNYLQYLFGKARNLVRYRTISREVYKLSRKRILKYRNIYKGKRCFIIGNGPSLTADDLELLKDEICFASNKIYKIYDKTSWRAKFYCVQDFEVATEMGQEMKIAMDQADATFFRMDKHDLLESLVLEYKNALMVPLRWYLNKKKKTKFSGDARSYLYDGTTVTYMAMQLAVYMGFEKIYFIGVDHNYPFYRNEAGDCVEVDKNMAAHFYENSVKGEEANVSAHRSNNKFMQDVSYSAAKAFCERNGNVTFYNATRGGKLDIFERVDLEDILKQNRGK